MFLGPREAYLGFYVGGGSAGGSKNIGGGPIK